MSILSAQVFTPRKPPLQFSTRQSIAARETPNPPKKPSFDLAVTGSVEAQGVP